MSTRAKNPTRLPSFNALSFKLELKSHWNFHFNQNALEDFSLGPHESGYELC